jgi:hypothetical protein
MRKEVIQIVQKRECYTVFSDVNPWIGFHIILSPADSLKAKQIIQESEDKYWIDDRDSGKTLADYICSRLAEKGIEYEIYFKNGQKDAFNKETMGIMGICKSFRKQTGLGLIESKRILNNFGYDNNGFNNALSEVRSNPEKYFGARSL